MVDPGKMQAWLGDEVLRAPAPMVAELVRGARHLDALAASFRQGLPSEVLDAIEHGSARREQIDGQAHKAMRGFRAKLPRKLAGAFERWTKSHEWADFMALARRLGIQDQSAFAAWSTAVKRGWTRR